MSLEKHCKDLENFEFILVDLIEEVHKEGVLYWEMLRFMLEMCSTLQMKADAEYWKNIK